MSPREAVLLPNPPAYLGPLSAFAGHSYATTEALLQAILQLIAEQLGLRTSFLSHIVREENRNTIVAAFNQSDGSEVVVGADLPLHATWCSLIAAGEDPRPVLVGDAQHDPGFTLHPAAAAFPTIGAFIGVPIVLADATFYGTLCATAPQRYEFTPSQTDLLVVLARIVATQIERDQAMAARSAAEEEQTRLLAAAQAALQERDDFMSTTAHELRTPLTSLLGYASLLQRHATRGGAFTERDQQIAKTIVAQVERLNTMVGDLLNASRVERDEFVTTRVPLDLALLVARLVAETRLPLTEHTLTLHTSSKPMLIAGDQHRLEQAVRNLLSNAVKYSPRGGDILISLEQSDKAYLRIQDHGLGIPAAALPELFRRFYRAPNGPQHNITGFGIGLYVVKEIVTRHGGTITVVSTEGYGSTFTIVLPLLSTGA